MNRFYLSQHLPDVEFQVVSTLQYSYFSKICITHRVTISPLLMFNSTSSTMAWQEGYLVEASTLRRELYTAWFRASNTDSFFLSPTQSLCRQAPHYQRLCLPRTSRRKRKLAVLPDMVLEPYPHCSAAD